MIKKIYNYLFNNKLTVNDYLKYKNNMWEHYCEVEKDIIGIEKGKPCNWCDLTEEKLRNKYVYKCKNNT